MWKWVHLKNNMCTWMKMTMQLQVSATHFASPEHLIPKHPFSLPAPRIRLGVPAGGLAALPRQTAEALDTKPFTTMYKSGVGVVPKKSGKLRLIHHLSSPRAAASMTLSKRPTSVSIIWPSTMLFQLSQQQAVAATYRKSTSSRHSASARSVPPTGPSLAPTGKGHITLDVPYRLTFALARQSTQRRRRRLDPHQQVLQHCSPSLPGRLLERCRAQFTGRHETAPHHSQPLPLSGYSHCHGQNARPKASSPFPWRRTWHCPIRGTAARWQTTRDQGSSATTTGSQPHHGRLSRNIPGQALLHLPCGGTGWDVHSSLVGLERRYHKAKAQYRVKISAECRHNLLGWQVLLDQWNGPSFFLNAGKTPATDLGIYTSVSGLGWGAYFGQQHRWTYGEWEKAEDEYPIESFNGWRQVHKSRFSDGSRWEIIIIKQIHTFTATYCLSNDVST